MAEIVKPNKPLAIDPLKTSQAVGAALAVLGLDRAMPILHGSQGCTAFAKVQFVRHFLEPIPLQTTAMDHVASIMGADENLLAGLETVCQTARPAVVGLLTTGLAEVEGVDIQRLIKTFKAQSPTLQPTRVVAVNTPDFEGCLETGFAAAVKAMIEQWVPPATDCNSRPGRRPQQVNVLTGAALTPGDLEALKEIIENFGLQPVVVPDISDSLDGHLNTEAFTPVTSGGTPVSAFPQLGNAAATVVIGASLYGAADRLQELTDVPDYRFPHLMTLDTLDNLIMTLAGIAGVRVPEKLERQRTRLQDAMLDTHAMIGQARFAIAGDGDLINGLSHLLTAMGGEVVAAVTPCRVPGLEQLPVDQVTVGDLDDLQTLARSREAELIIANSHAAESARRLNLPLLRAGFPLYDLIGGYQRTWIGYAGIRQTLFDLANILLTHDQHDIAPYHCSYSRKSDHDQAIFDHEATTAGHRWRH